MCLNDLLRLVAETNVTTEQVLATLLVDIVAFDIHCGNGICKQSLVLLRIVSLVNEQEFLWVDDYIN